MDILCREISASSNGLKDTMSLILAYAHRSDSILGKLLGQAYGVDDIIFYLSASTGILGLGASKKLQTLRLPMAGTIQCFDT